MSGCALDEGGEQRVALHLSAEKHRQQDAEGKKEQVGGQEGDAIGAHIFLRLLQRAAGQVLLHHILIEPCHHDHDEHAAEELFPEVVGRHPVVEHEDAAHLAVSNGVDCLSHRQTQAARHLADDQDKGREEAERLEGVGEHQRADAAPSGVEPDKQHHPHDIGDEGNARRVEHELLQDHTDHVELDRRSRDFRQQEEPGTRQIGPSAQPLSQIGIDAREVQPIIKW